MQVVTSAEPGSTSGQPPMPYRSSAPTTGQARSTAATRAAPTTHAGSRHPSASTAHTASAPAVVARRTVTMPVDIPTAGRQPDAAVIVAGTAARPGRT